MLPVSYLFAIHNILPIRSCASAKCLASPSWPNMVLCPSSCLYPTNSVTPFSARLGIFNSFLKKIARESYKFLSTPSSSIFPPHQSRLTTSQTFSKTFIFMSGVLLKHRLPPSSGLHLPTSRLAFMVCRYGLTLYRRSADCFIQRPSPYRAVNTFHLGYKNRSVYAVSGTSRCLFPDKYKTYKYSVGRAYNC